MECPKCKKVTSNNRFCSECGFKLSGSGRPIPPSGNGGINNPPWSDPSNVQNGGGTRVKKAKKGGINVGVVVLLLLIVFAMAGATGYFIIGSGILEGADGPIADTGHGDPDDETPTPTKKPTPTPTPTEIPTPTPEPDMRLTEGWGLGKDGVEEYPGLLSIQNSVIKNEIEYCYGRTVVGKNYVTFARKDENECFFPLGYMPYMLRVYYFDENSDLQAERTYIFAKSIEEAERLKPMVESYRDQTLAQYPEYGQSEVLVENNMVYFEDLLFCHKKSEEKSKKVKATKKAAIAKHWFDHTGVLQGIDKKSAKLYLATGYDGADIRKSFPNFDEIVYK